MDYFENVGNKTHCRYVIKYMWCYVLQRFLTEGLSHLIIKYDSTLFHQVQS